MANGQSGLSLAAPPGGGSGINLDQVLPFLMLLSPLLEMRNPGSGLGLSAGILGYQQAQQKKRQGESMSLLQLLSEVDDDQLETAQGALIDAGYTPALVKAMAKASRGMVDPARKAERALNQLVNDPSLGLIPRRTQIDIQARRQTEEQVAGREDVRFQRQETAESQRFERGQTAGIAGEARSLLTSILLNPGASPQSRVQAQRLFSQLAQGGDPQAILAEAQALVGQVGEAGAAQGLQERQLAFRQRRVAELEAEVESAVPAAAGRIRRLAKEQGLDPAPYLQRLVQNIRQQKLQEQVLARQAAGPQGGLSLSDLKLALFLGQIDPSKLSDEQRTLVGLGPKPKVVPPLSHQARVDRIAQINRRLAIIQGASGTEMTIDQALKLQDEEDRLLGERDKLMARGPQQTRGR